MLRIQHRYIWKCASLLSVIFISLVHSFQPKPFNQTSASTRKIKAKQGANCLLFFPSDPSPSSVLWKIPQIWRPLWCIPRLWSKSRIFEDLTPWGVGRAPLAWIRPQGKAVKTQSSPHGKQAHLWLLKRWFFPCIENIPSPLLFFLPCRVSSWIWDYFCQGLPGKQLWPEPSATTTTFLLPGLNSRWDMGKILLFCLNHCCHLFLYLFYGE